MILVLEINGIRHFEAKPSQICRLGIRVVGRLRFKAKIKILKLFHKVDIKIV